MMKLSDRNWEAFYISNEKENGIFKLRASMSGITEYHYLSVKNKKKNINLTMEMLLLLG